MVTLPKDFREFIELLNRNKVRYLIIGGYAVVYHGYVRSTNDMDIWVIDLENLLKSKRAAGRTRDLADIEELTG